jgi:hypothetical protein
MVTEPLDVDGKPFLVRKPPAGGTQCLPVNGTDEPLTFVCSFDSHLIRHPPCVDVTGKFELFAAAMALDENTGTDSVMGKNGTPVTHPSSNRLTAFSSLGLGS